LRKNGSSSINNTIIFQKVPFYILEWGIFDQP
jgi:hypothetical protein